MSRYFFDLCDNGRMVVDRLGLQLPDVKAMQKEAALLLVELNRDHILSDRPGVISVEVRDGDGTVMKAQLTFDFPAAVPG